ncbi:anaerobic C4-dicarboxylate transporter family protein [Agromyces archimandritae]|uniref:Anaerobic C4-dicarboxylate transporter family protein n=1 Tax=Agromyces archimandritae TaxID=2781962 RepID=A0A975IMN7_9MICO|nr:anaerobic C4-dicarboxylate transporter family protein [Agromyces archimandritae]QTX03712.1 anaerobic C4-dicarboxylate transporter family protein [Agromyces archimandritae]
MEIFLAIVQACVVLGAIVLGVRMGGIGLGLWGVVGTGVLVFGFGLAPGDLPIDAFFIIIAVITASAAMQAAGGIDYLVGIASKIIRANPKRLTYVAPLVAFAFTALSGTSNIFFALIPVIYETAYRNGQRPERSLAASTVTSGLGITASPVSAAMAAYLVLVEPQGFPLPRILMITVPAAIVACIVTSFVQQRIGKELIDDPKFLKRVEAGEVEMPPVLAAKYRAKLAAEGGAGGGVGGSSSADAAGSATATDAGNDTSSGSGGSPASTVEATAPHEQPVPKGGRSSAWVFIAAIIVIVALGLFPSIRPQVPTGDDGETEAISMSIVIEILMFTAALVIMIMRKVKPAKVLDQSLMASGFIAAIALFGIAWMADTFIGGNQETIIDPLGDLITHAPLLLAVALFIVCGLTTSQSATTNMIVPIAIAAAVAPGVITAMWPSLIGVWLFPANGSQIAAVETDRTGTTKLSPVPIWHSFTIPMLVSWVAVVGVGLLIQLIP